MEARLSNILPARRIIGKLERLSRERGAREMELAYGGRSVRDPRDTTHPRGFWFDAEAGNFAVQWIEKYGRHHKGEWAGRPLILEDWQRENLRQMFGWKRPDGTRRYRKAWWEIPRKNGKTQIAGGVGLFLLVGDNEPGAEVYTTATKKEQAAICHEAARQMVKRSPELREIVKVPKNKLANLTCEALGSMMGVLASDHGTLDGLNPHGDIRDEIHQWKAHELAEVLDTATGARRQPMTLEITTAGVYDPEGVGWKHHKYAVDVLEGAIEDDSIFAYVAAAEENDDPWDPSVWWTANPNLGVSLKLAYMQDEASKARTQIEALNGFLTKLLNRWTAQVDRWLDPERWRQSEDPKFSEADLAGRECVGAIDLSLRQDVTALVLVFRRPDGGFDLTCRFWLPESTIEEEAKKGRGYWRAWRDQGWLTEVPGDTIQHAYIRAEAQRLAEKFSITEFGYDPANANLFASAMSDDGFTMVEVRQGALSLSEPAKLLEASIFARKVRATGPPGGPNPIMRFMVGNAVARKNVNGDIRPDKARALGKIDGVSAAVTALSRIVGGETESGSYLDSSPLIML